MMDKDHFILLLTKVLSGNATPEDEAVLQQTLKEQKEFHSLYDQYKKYWSHHDNSQSAAVEKALAATWNRINLEKPADPFATPVRRISWWKKVAAAAVLAGVAFLSWQLFYNSSGSAVPMADIYNPKGIRSAMVLPDGSKVWLAADSRLKYPKTFSPGQRDIYLEGEAFFEVTKNPEKPFIVHLNEGAVKVVGTSFDIKAYDESNEIMTSVATGKVAFIPGKNKADTAWLTPNNKSVYNTVSGKTIVKPTDALADKGWVDGILFFDSETLADIVTVLERYYGKDINFRDLSLKDFRYTGKFYNSSPEEILQYLSKTKTFTYTVSDSLIVIGK